MKRYAYFLCIFGGLGVLPVLADNCVNVPTATQLRQYVKAAATTQTPIGGLFEGTRMWVAVVNRDGELCSAAASTDDPAGVWPGSQAIAKSKAYTANAF